MVGIIPGLIAGAMGGPPIWGAICGGPGMGGLVMPGCMPVTALGGPSLGKVKLCRISLTQGIIVHLLAFKAPELVKLARICWAPIITGLFMLIWSFCGMDV